MTEWASRPTARGPAAADELAQEEQPGLYLGRRGASIRRLRPGVRGDDVPEPVDEFLAHARAVRDAPTLVAGQVMAASLIDRYGAAYPSA
ncbi:MAG: hypothetical protein M3P10_10490, partial [Actinomycetota bacterium]|nr:hypothetical protein [Actinomycetota bacterium]